VIPGKQYTPEILLSIAWRRKWWILVPALVIGTTASLVTRQLPNLFQADATILVVPQRVPENYVRPTVTASIDDRLMTISQQILSRSRLERVIQDFNLYADLRKTWLMEDIVEAMRGQIGWEAVRGDAFRVSFTSEDPRTAMRVTEKLASLFIDENLRDRENLAEGTNRFLDSQLDEARRRLIENERKLEAYRRAHDGELPNQVEANLEGMHNAGMQLQALTEALNRDRDRRLVLERIIADANAAESITAPPPPPGDAGSAGTAADELRNAEATLLAMQLRLKPSHPDIAILKRQITQLQRRVEAEDAAQPVSDETITPGEGIRRNRLNESKAEIASLDQQIAAKLEEEKRLHGIVADYQRKIETAPTRETELTDLTRDYETFGQVYRELLTKKSESNITANLERRQIGEQFRMLDPPRLPERPSSPNRPKLYLMGIAAAFGVGLGLSALLEYFDRSMRSEEDVRAALNLLVLATVPVIRGAQISKRRRQLLALSVSVGLAAALTAAVVAWRLLR
jgi:polysaccharide chain length determinant protein (PEP-CTERM system associated)